MRWLLLILLIIGFCFFIYFHGYSYLNYATLKTHHKELQLWSAQHYLLAVIVFILIYILAVALSIPGAVFITLTGGFLFGPIATLYVVLGATIGAMILFIAVRTAFGGSLAQKAHGWVTKMEKGFQKNAFNYLLVLRLIPIFPFWAINIAAALLNVPLRTFLIATFIGIIPGAFIYVMIGNSLNAFFATDQAPNLNIIFRPSILLPLIALAFIAILPIIYKKWKGHHNE